MDSTIIAAIIGGSATITAAIITVLFQSRRKKKAAPLPSGKLDQIEVLLKEVVHSTSQRAKEIEMLLFDLVKNEPSLIFMFQDRYEAPAREAIAVVAGKLIYKKIQHPDLIKLLEKYLEDPDKWVRIKAQNALELVKK